MLKQLLLSYAFSCRKSPTEEALERGEYVLLVVLLLLSARRRG